MRATLREVPGDSIVGLPIDELEISPLFRGQLGIRQPGSIGWNNGMPRVEVVLLDSGQAIQLTWDIQVEVFAVEEVRGDEIPEFRGGD